MKKALALLLSLSVVCMVFAACGKTDTPVDGGNTANMSNPVVEYDSLEKINEAAKTNLVTPGVMGVTDESFSVISHSIAQYKFMLGGCEYCFRACGETDDDISGIYLDNGKLAFEDRSGDGEVVSTGEFKACRFFVAGIQYVISVTDNGNVAGDTFDGMCEDLQNAIISAVSDPEVVKLAGSYQDSYTKRANAQVKLYDKDAPEITIEWASSVTQNDTWVIKTVKDGAKLSYKAEDMKHLRTQGENQEELNDCTAGYFEITDAGICWTGSGSDSTSGCVFVKAQ